MAHSYVQAHESEAASFESFARAHPRNAVLLIDTYDTEAAAHEVVTLARKLAAEGLTIRGVRIDSGDLAEHARRVRAILDAGGLAKTTIFASGNLDEFRLRDLVMQAAPIDGYGVGTRMNTSADAPYLDCAYKLQEYDGRARRKRSEGKATWPGRKQVWRHYGPDGRIARDVLSVEGDNQTGEPLIEPVMKGGRRLGSQPTLAEIRARAARDLERLPEPLRRLQPGASCPVEVADALTRLAAEVDRRLAQQARL
jgi:nicotinate phosphoribosyltransferase